MPTATSQASPTTPSPPRRLPQPAIEPEIAWKENLYKTIEGTFQSLVDDAKRDYDERIAVAGTAEERGLAGEEYHKNMDNIRNQAKESFQAQLEQERQARTLALEQAEQEAFTTPAEKTSQDTIADTTTDDSYTSNPISALDRIGELPAGPSPSSHNAPIPIPTASPRTNVESTDGQLSRRSEIQNFGSAHPQPAPGPPTRPAALTLGAAPINVGVGDLPPELAVQRSPQSQPGSNDDSHARENSLRSPIPPLSPSEAGQSQYQLTSANDQVPTGSGDKFQGLHEGKLPSAPPLQPPPSRHERWLPSAEEIVAYTPGALSRLSLPRHGKRLPSTEEAVPPSSRAALEPSPSPHERWLPSTVMEAVSPTPLQPSPERHERWLRSAQAILPPISRTLPPQDPRPISDITLTNKTTMDFSVELAAQRRQYSSLYWGGYPRRPISSLPSSKIEGSPQNPRASADNQVPTDSKDSGPFSGDNNGWKEMLRKVEDISRQWAVVRPREAGRQEAAGRKEEAQKNEGSKPTNREQEAGNKEEELAKREQELKKREEASRQEMESVHKDQEAKKNEEELRRRAEELCEEKRRFEEQREEVRRKEEEELRQQAGQLGVQSVEASGREEAQRCGTLITDSLGHQGAEPQEREERIRRLGRTSEEEGATEGKGSLRREQEEPDYQLSAEKDEQSKQAGVREAERRPIVEISGQKETGQWERRQGEEQQEIHQQAEEGKHQRTYANAYYPAGSTPSWTLSQADAWGSSQSSWSARTSIASYSTIFEQTDDGMRDWQRRQEEMYHEQQEQFREAQERLESPNQAHGASRGPTKKAV